MFEGTVMEEEALMSNQIKVNIYDVLDMFNEEVGYKGLDNTGKATDERDDVITRQTFHNWVTEYNATNLRKIKGEKVNQYNDEWFKSDVEKLIQNPKIQKRLKQSYLRRTEPLFEGFEEMGLTSKRISKKYKAEKMQGNIEGFVSAITSRIDQLIDEIIGENFTLLFDGSCLEVKSYINRNEIIKDFIDMEKVEEEAMKIEDNFYGISEYDSTGNIVAVHHKGERKETKYFLKG
jgi:hypothetical protein